MNAVIGLCHFCESHGPSAIFCTETLRETRIEDITFRLVNLPNPNCPCCNSIGTSQAFVTRDNDGGANFFSSQVPVIPELVPLLKTAATRSLSCETSFNKNGGFVFFGDAPRGHVLSHTFHVADSQARGFFKLFSIIVLMKDKSFLLNIQPFLAEKLREISREVQQYAEKVYAADQRRGSQRAERLNTGQVTSNTSRSLIELTGEKNIFGYLHSHFSWLLWAGARYLTETVTLGSPSAPPWIAGDTEEGFSIVQVDQEEFLLQRMAKLSVNEDENPENWFTIRRSAEIMGPFFVSVCFCVLTGVQIVIRGNEAVAGHMVRSLKSLLPEPMHILVREEPGKYQPASEFRILSLASGEVAPTNAGLFRVDILDDADSVEVKWSGDVPHKWPNLLSKIQKAIDESALNNLVLERHLRVLVEEWKNKILALKKIRSTHDAAKLKKILGVQAQDQPLVTYWSTYLH